MFLLRIFLTAQDPSDQYYGRKNKLPSQLPGRILTAEPSRVMLTNILEQVTKHMYLKY